MTDHFLTVAIVFATLFGPIFAVIVTRFNDQRARRYARRSDTFRTLMATRAAPISVEHVGALNTVEVDFHGVASVMAALTIYEAHLNSEFATSDPNGLAWQDRRRDLFAVLLSRMAQNIGVAKSEIAIRQGGYYPKGWTARDVLATASQEWVHDLSTGARAVPVHITNLPLPPAAPVPVNQNA